MKTKSTLFFLFIGLCLANSFYVMAQPALLITKKRAPHLDITTYKQIAIGDIVGSSGSKNEKSMDLTDDLTSKLFNSNTYEVVDRNTLTQILSSQKNTDIKLINESTTAALSKNLNSAILIIGRLQGETLEQTLKKQTLTVVINNCDTHYSWVVTGEVSMQVKIIDIKSGKMLFSNPVVAPISLQSEPTCEPTAKFAPEPIMKKAMANLATEITKILIPYEEKMYYTFDEPALAVFKNPFKKLEQAVSYLKMNDFPKGLEILEAYTADKTFKPNILSKAYFNYGLGLLANNQYDQAKAQFKEALVLTPGNRIYQYYFELTDKEKALDKNSIASK